MAHAHTKQQPPLVLDGVSLCAEDLVALSRGGIKIALSAEAWERVAHGREVVDNILKDSTRVAYGINTGFGLFSNVVISPDKLSELQENLIRSHSSGTGEPLTPSQTRMLLALRINVLSKGHSGIRVATLQQLIAAFNADCLSVVPCKGTVGASGDLAPLAHLALGMMGEGPMWNKIVTNGVTSFEIAEAADVLAKNGLRPVQLGAKEGLAMINGTQLITCIGAEAVVRAENAAKCADVAVSLSLEVLMGTVNAFHPRIHEVRPHAGQQLVAARIRTLLQADEPSELFRSHNYVGKVQDAYTLRCAPQIHGVVHDTIQFVKNIINVEMNSATDNPMVFTGSAEVTTDFSPQPPSDQASGAAPAKNASELTDLSDAKREIARLHKVVQDQKDHQASGLKRTTDTFYRGGGGFIISGGNFHGEYPAKAMDFLAIAIHEIASVSERRIERLVNPSLSNLPAFLVNEGGLNSGFMIAHCTAAALVSENKVLTHPSSVDSISTSGGKEDHVSMGGFAARKALTVVEHVETVVAIEILAACQALDLLRPLRTTAALEALHALVRTRVAPLDKDRFMKPDIDAVIDLVQSGQVLAVVQPYLDNLHVSRL